MSEQKPEFWITWRTKDGKKKLDPPECTTNKAYAEQHKEWEWISFSDIEKDAIRYRWLRDNKYLDSWWSVDGPEDRRENIDKDINAAIEAHGSGKV